MSVEQLVVVWGVTILLSGIAGWLTCERFYRKQAWQYYLMAEDYRETAEEYAELLGDFREASVGIVHRMKTAIAVDCKEFPAETAREFDWSEIEPLAKCLKKLEECQ